LIQASQQASRADALITRALDLTVAPLLLLALSPVLAIAAIAIVVDSGRPVFFRRRVLGRGGKEFDAYKLRTMRHGAEDIFRASPNLIEAHRERQKLTDDPRVTPVGRPLRKYSIDEVPQLVNVIRGQMSLVGPRMIHPSEIERFGALGPRLLERRPGLTGLWQVTGRNDLPFSAHLALDQEYVETRSLGLDLKLLLKTIPAVLKGRGAY
jgi:lipopolysaccharide/colanic/teichoic acid biosynthesis glycosyltransferase